MGALLVVRDIEASVDFRARNARKFERMSGGSDVRESACVRTGLGAVRRCECTEIGSERVREKAACAAGCAEDEGGLHDEKAPLGKEMAGRTARAASADASFVPRRRDVRYMNGIGRDRVAVTQERQIFPPAPNAADIEVMRRTMN